MKNRLPGTLLSLALVCSPALPLTVLAQQPAPPQDTTQLYVYTGTVHAVQSQTGSLDLITGMGHALRLVHIRTLPATQTMSGVATIRFADLAPGDKLRADCRMTPSGLIADRIEKLPAPGQSP
jgi:hypothetical protein